MKRYYRRVTFVSMAFMAICAFWQLYDQVVPMMLTNTFGLGDMESGMVMALDNVLALFLIPFFGAISDKTRNPLGRRMPYIIIGTLMAVSMAVLLPYADMLGNLQLFFTVMALLVFAMAVYRAPAVALMADVTPKPLRSQGNAIVNVFGVIGAMVTLVLIWLLVEDTPGSRPSYEPVFWAVSGMMMVALVVLLLSIRENKLVREMVEMNYGVDRYSDDAARVDFQGQERLTPPLRRSMLLMLASVALWFMGYNAVISAYSRYAMVVWGLDLGISSLSLLVANGGAMLAFLPVGWLTPMVGRRRMVCIGIVLVAASFAVIGLFEAFSPVLYLLFVFVGCGWACINVNGFPMIVDLSRGANNGRFTGYYYAASMLAQIITPVLSGHLLENVGYGTLFPYAAVMVGLALVTMAFVKHGDCVPWSEAHKPQAS